MNDESRRQEMVSLRDYVDTRFAAESKAVILALETVKVAMERDDRKLSSTLSVIAILVSVAVGVFEIARHT
jgi:hypothetical protein